MQQPVSLILCATLPVAVCVAAHYFPWRFWFRRGRLPRPLAYTVGLLAILLPATVAMLFAVRSVQDAVALLWLAAGSAGVGTLCAWWYDWHNRTELQRQREADKELFSDDDE